MRKLLNNRLFSFALFITCITVFYAIIALTAAIIGKGDSPLTWAAVWKSFLVIFWFLGAPGYLAAIAMAIFPKYENYAPGGALAFYFLTALISKFMLSNDLGQIDTIIIAAIISFLVVSKVVRSVYGTKDGSLPDSKERVQSQGLLGCDINTLWRADLSLVNAGTKSSEAVEHNKSVLIAAYGEEKYWELFRIADSKTPSK